MLLSMMGKQHGFLALLFVLGCQHEAAMGSTDTQTPKAEAAPAKQTAPVKAQAIAAPSGGCSADADCHAVDAYCGSCQCLALPSAAAAPECDGDQVQCFAAPCRGQHAVCAAGRCTLAGSGDM